MDFCSKDLDRTVERAMRTVVKRSSNGRRCLMSVFTFQLDGTKLYGFAKVPKKGSILLLRLKTKEGYGNWTDEIIVPETAGSPKE